MAAQLAMRHPQAIGAEGGDPATVVVDKSNDEPYELPVEQRTCPALEAAAN